MDSDFTPIREALTRLPNLARYVKDKQINALPADPLRYRHPLFWFLANIDRLSDKLRTLDTAFDIVHESGIQGAPSKLKALVSSENEWWSHLAEVYFSAWLIQNDLDILMPSSGPDYTIRDPNGSMFVEFTSLARGNWIDRLVERAGVLADRNVTNVTVWYRLHRAAPNDLKTQWVIIDRVTDALLDLRHPSILVRRHFELGGHDIYLDVSPARNEPTLYAVGPESQDLAVPAARLSSLIERKARNNQIRRGNASSLVVDVSGIEGSHQWIIEEPDRVWLTIPLARERLSGLYVYWSSLDRHAPFACTKFVNALREPSESSVSKRFDEVICMRPHSDPFSHPSRAETSRILRQLGPQPWAVELSALVLHGKFDN